MATQSGNDELRRKFTLLVEEIQMSWALWIILFRTAWQQNAKERLLTEIAPRFHRYGTWHFLTAVVLGLSRLGDPLQQCGRDNLTLERVFNGTDFTGRDKDKNDVERAMQEALKLIRGGDFKLFRDRLIAHNDLEAAIGGTVSGPSLEVVRKAVGWTARFHARIDAIWKGKPLDISSGEGREPSPQLELDCQKEAQRLIDLLRAGNDCVHLKR